MPVYRQLQSAAVVVAASFLIGCGVSPVEGVIEDPQGTPRIVRESTGGIATLRVIVEIDSATSMWSRATCPLSTDAASCGTRGHLEGGQVDPQVRDQLFTEAREPVFLALPARYRSTVQVADGMDHSLRITTGGYTRTIEWEDGAEIPGVLDAYLGRFAAALRP
jgi:hypothetical protein